MKFETAFRRAWGRSPTRAEVASVERVCDAFEVQDNDALKAIAGVLEYYHTHLRAYPGQCTTAVQLWLGSPEGAAALARAMRTTSSPGELPSPASANTSRASPTDPLHWVTLAAFAMASSSISGVLGMLVGSVLSGRQPCWVPRGTRDLITVSLLGAPMGWIFLLPLLVATYFGVAWGWRRGVDPKCATGSRWLGWATAAAITAVALSWGALVTRLMIRG